MHLRAALAFTVLGRRRRCYQRGIHDGAFLEQQALVAKMLVDRSEDFLGEGVCFQQATELQQCGRIRRRFMAQVNPDKQPYCLAVVRRIFRAPHPKAQSIAARHTGATCVTVRYGDGRACRCCPLRKKSYASEDARAVDFSGLCQDQRREKNKSASPSLNSDFHDLLGCDAFAFVGGVLERVDLIEVHVAVDIRGHGIDLGGVF